MVDLSGRLNDYMLLAVEEAKTSLREGNCGFGAVIINDGRLIARSHDTEKTENDPTAHAELTAIRFAAAEIGRDLSGCVIVSTHEPCPMCSTAILWAGIDTITYGCSIAESIKQGRRRIDLPCREVFERAGKPVTIYDGVLKERCSVLYDRRVREQVELLRGADEAKLAELANELTQKRLGWLEQNREALQILGQDPLEAAYSVLTRKLGIAPEDAPIICRDPDRVVIASRNFCPTLEACDILGLDTRTICKRFTEEPMAALLRQVHPGLRFSRNYQTLRPYGEYCEEIISLTSA